MQRKHVSYVTLSKIQTEYKNSRRSWKKKYYRKNIVVYKSVSLGIIVLFAWAGIIPSTVAVFGEEIRFSPFMSDDYIQNMIDNASDGDLIFIPSGTYYEHIVIDKTISLIGEEKNTTIIDGGYVGTVITIVSDQVNVSGFTIRNSDGKDNARIFFDPSSTSSTTNTIISNGYGIFLTTDNNTICNNVITNNGYGIFASGSNSNTISDNIITSNGQGINLDLYNSAYNTIINNTIRNNAYGLLASGSNSNTISENIIIGNVRCLVLVGDRNTIAGNTITEGYSGLDLSGNNNSISSNTITHNDYGIYLTYSDYNDIINNDITHNRLHGIRLHESGHTTITGNTISQNENGIVPTSNSRDNTIAHNSILQNGAHAVYFNQSYNNTIASNTIQLNNNGVYLENSSGNIILKNNFQENTHDAFFNRSIKNRWKQNYWNRPRILPKLIFGSIQTDTKEVPWFNIDWRPAFRPLDSSRRVT